MSTSSPSNRPTEVAGRPGWTPADRVAGRPELPPVRTLRTASGADRVLRTVGVAGPHTPSVLLVHGWMATADLTWAAAFGPLADDGHHLLAPDLDGHGDEPGETGGRRFRLEACADRLADLVAGAATGSVVVVGYSMGGAVAQLLWRRHPERVAGLVLCATADRFRHDLGDRVYFGAWDAAAAALGPLGAARRRRFHRRLVERRTARYDLGPWGRAELARGDLATLARAGGALGRFRSTDWLCSVDVPTAVVVTTCDDKVPTHRQYRLAGLLPGATVHPVEGGHHACVDAPDRFVPALRRAVAQVVAASEPPLRSGYAAGDPI